MSAKRRMLLGIAGLSVALAGCGQKPAEADGAQTPDAAADPAAATSAALASAPPTPPDVVIGTAPPLPTGRPALDTLGVSLGQPLDGARAAFKAASASSDFTYYKETLLGLPSPMPGRFISGLFAQNQPRAGVTSESLGALLTGPPLTPQVWFVGRSMTYARGKEPALPAVLKALTDKYGPPQRTQPPFTYYWSWDAAGAPTGAPPACAPHAQIGSQLAGTVTSPAVAVSSSAVAPPAACARVIKAELRGSGDLVSEMDLGLTDNDLMWKARAQTLAAAEGQAATAREEALKNAAGNTPKL